MRLSLFLFSLVCVGALFGKHPVEEQPSFEVCGNDPHSMRAGIRHIEANGIGYNQGYSTLELFISQLTGPALCFSPLRAHIFNNGKWAANGGIGFRYLTYRHVFGANLFYDYRQTERRRYSQVGFGLESLGERWDFRMNGYFPVGTTSSHFSRNRQEFAMSGADAEVGARLKYLFNIQIPSFDLYAAAGPYYYAGKGKNAGGGKVRILGKYLDYITLEGSFSYDNIFHDIYQIQVGLNYAFGHSGPLKRKSDDERSCDNWMGIRNRLVQNVNRAEIVVVDHRN